MNWKEFLPNVTISRLPVKIVADTFSSIAQYCSLKQCSQGKEYSYSAYVFELPYTLALLIVLLYCNTCSGRKSTGYKMKEFNTVESGGLGFQSMCWEMHLILSIK